MRHKSVNTGWGISPLTPLYPTNGLSYAPGSQYVVVGGKAARNTWHRCYGRHLEGRHLECVVRPNFPTFGHNNFSTNNVDGNGLHHCSSEIKLVLNDVSHAPLPICYSKVGSKMAAVAPKSRISCSFTPTTTYCEPGAYDKPFVLTDLCLSLYTEIIN
jgi:hypothetical protein